MCMAPRAPTFKQGNWCVGVLIDTAVSELYVSNARKCGVLKRVEEGGAASVRTTSLTA